MLCSPLIYSGSDAVDKGDAKMGGHTTFVSLSDMPPNINII